MENYFLGNGSLSKNEVNELANAYYKFYDVLYIDIISLQSYSMRNGILALMGEIVIKVLSKEDLDDAAKKLRDQLLDKMEVSTMPEETNAHKTYYENLKKNVHTCSHVILKPLKYLQ